MELEKAIKSILQQNLQLGEEVHSFSEHTELLGAIPELDSMGVVNVITGLEENFGFEIEDDEISAEVFETFGTLLDFIKSKL